MVWALTAAILIASVAIMTSVWAVRRARASDARARAVEAQLADAVEARIKATADRAAAIVEADTAAAAAAGASEADTVLAKTRADADRLASDPDAQVAAIAAITGIGGDDA